MSSQEKRAQVQLEQDLRFLVAQPQFCRWLFVVLDSRCGVEGPIFRTDAAAMAFLEGRRSIGIEIKRELLDIVPDAFARALTADMQERIEHARAAKNDQEDAQDAAAAND